MTIHVTVLCDEKRSGGRDRQTGDISGQTAQPHRQRGGLQRQDRARATVRRAVGPATLRHLAQAQSKPPFLVAIFEHFN